MNCRDMIMVWPQDEGKEKRKERQKMYLGSTLQKKKHPGTFCAGSECCRPASASGLYCTYSCCAAGAGSWSEPQQGTVLTLLLARNTGHPHLVIWVFFRLCQHQPRWFRQYVTPFSGHRVFILSCFRRNTSISYSTFYIADYLNIMKYLCGFYSYWYQPTKT